MLALRSLFLTLISLVLLAALAVGGTFIALNTSPGRAFATQEINHVAGPNLTITGLAGHFPADLKLASVTLSDSNGIYATGQNLELRWHPLALLHRDLEITGLTAASLDVLRTPAPGKSTGNKPATSPPNFHLDLDALSIPRLHLGAALAGEDVTLNIQGSAHFKNIAHGSVALDATTPSGAATYQLTAGIDPQTVALKAHIAEPPDGLIGHFAGRQLHAPLHLDLTLYGPRGNAALNFTAALGAAQLAGTGTLGLVPSNPHADVVFTVPQLAPYAAIAGQQLAGNTKLHLVISQAGNSANLALDGNVSLQQAPDHLAALVGQAGKFSLRANLAGQSVEIDSLTLTGAQCSAAISGFADDSGANLNTQLTLDQVATLSPGISGSVSETGDIIGQPKDFGIDAQITGDIAARNIPSGPFSITLNAQHLPTAPTGTLTGSGALENAPLLLDAEFTRDPAGNASVKINNALWRSLNARADLALAAGAKIPTGTANFSLGNLRDFAAFSPVPLRGSVTGDFSNLGAQTFKLDLTARNLVAGPRLGPVNATIHALGPTSALSVQAQASLQSLFAHPARLALTGVFDLANRSANLTSLTAAWHQLDLRLLGPTQIATQPGITIRHLAATLNGARLGIDGTLSPRLNANLSIQNLPARLAGIFLPSLAVTGTLSATAHVTGLATAPQGHLTLQASGVKLYSGPAAAIPPADLTATATIAGQKVNLAANLTAGPNIQLAADGLVSEHRTGALNLHVTGRTDLRLLDPILAEAGTVTRGIVAADLTLTGSADAPRADGSVTLSNGSVETIASGLDLTGVSAAIQATGQTVTLQHLSATAGQGSITGHGTLDLGAPDLPLYLILNAKGATPVSSDIVTETLDAALTLQGALRGRLALGGAIKLDRAEINIPKSLPPSVANLPIIDAGSTPPPPPAPPPPIAINLTVTAPNRIFVRGDGLFAELGGRLAITGTAADPDPEGGFDLIRGDFSLAGKSLQFTSGTISFNGDGFMPTLDLEASVTSNTTTANLIVGGTAAEPTITLTSTPPLPSDEILAQLLFDESTANLTPFQAASLAAALAQLSGVGGGANPLDSVRNALGLDELSLGGSGSGPPALQAGRYVAPGVYVGASQATNGQGTQASVEINLTKGLKLTTTTGTSGAGSSNSSSVGLTYQFNY